MTAGQIVEQVVGLLDKAGGGVETNQLGGEVGPRKDEGGGDEAVESGGTAWGRIDSEAELEEGGESGGFNADAAGESGVQVEKYALEGFVSGLEGRCLWNEERGRR